MTSPGALDGLRDPRLAILWSATRRRLENNGVTLTAVPLSLKNLDEGEMAALCALLGRRRPNGRTMKIDLRALDDSLKNSRVGVGLVGVLEAVGGPVRDRQAERLAAATAKLEIEMATGGHAAADDPDVRRWIESVRRRGKLTRLASIVDLLDGGSPDDRGIAREVMLETLDAVHWLRVNAEVVRASPMPLSTLAAVQLGDAHGLDPDTPVGSLLADALRHLSGADDGRAAWAAFGVQVDQISSSALALNLPGAADSICAAARHAGEPLRVTWRMIERGFGLDVDGLAGVRVRVCENPAIVSMAADRHGADCGPIVCTEGMPSGVAAALLDELTRAGADLRVHADFDLGGIAIGHHVVRRFGASPWRMGTADYVRALDGPTGVLVQEVGTVEWDPKLARAMNDHRRSVHEEAIAAVLLADLVTDPGSGSSTSPARSAHSSS